MHADIEIDPQTAYFAFDIVGELNGGRDLLVKEKWEVEKMSVVTG